MKGTTVAKKMTPGDPAWHLMTDGQKTVPEVYSKRCTICNCSDYAQMGMSLCYPCQRCRGHVPADDTICDDCGYDQADELDLGG